MSKMLEDYDHLLNIDPISQYLINPIEAESLFTSTNRKKESLNGKWNFSIDVYNTFYRKKFFNEINEDSNGKEIPVDYNYDKWEETKVPSNWNTENDKYFFYEGTAIYTRTFKYEANRDKETVILKIGAANYDSQIWLNKKLIARHVGGYTPFTIDITKSLESNNRITIVVNNQRKIEQIPSLNYDWKNYGGIYRDIEIFRVPETYISNTYFYLSEKDGFDIINAEITLRGNNKKNEKIKLNINELNINQTGETDEDGKVYFSIPCNLQRWDINNPKLYLINVESSDDNYSEQIGFRVIKKKGKDIYLNNKKLFLKGACVHEEEISKGKALDDSDRLNIISLAKEMGCNILRLSHYPHSEKMTKLADKIGILLWEEIPVYWALMFDNKETIFSAQNQMKELILRDRNRTSVIIWGVGNENPDTEIRLHFMKNLIQICKDLDPSRLVTAACLIDIDTLEIKDRLANYLDIISINEYYGWYYRDYSTISTILENSKINKPLLISETGADALSNYHGLEEELYTEEHQLKMYKKQIELTTKYIQGFFPWILIDFRSEIRMNNFQNFHNIKGLVDKDYKTKKLAYFELKKIYKNL